MAAQDQSLFHRELARRSQDIYRVMNPRKQDYKIVWDGYIEIVPAGGTADLPTYKMEKYLREMTDLILREAQDNAVKQENEERAQQGKKSMDKYEGENSRYSRANLQSRKVSQTLNLE